MAKQLSAQEAVTEAKRYLNNAKEILRDKGAKEDGFYQDSRYVKMAGHTAYSGVLFALDHYFGKKTKGREIQPLPGFMMNTNHIEWNCFPKIFLNSSFPSPSVRLSVRSANTGANRPGYGR